VLILRVSRRKICGNLKKGGLRGWIKKTGMETIYTIEMCAWEQYEPEKSQVIILVGSTFIYVSRRRGINKNVYRVNLFRKEVN